MLLTKDRLCKCLGATVDGKNPCSLCDCECPPGRYCWCYPDPVPPRQPKRPPRCPPPPPCPGTYWACRPKNYTIKSYPCKYCPGCCDRPCCKHYNGCEPCCKYDLPCKAQCFNHPPGMKPSGRYPPNVWRGPKCCA